MRYGWNFGSHFTIVAEHQRLKLRTNQLVILVKSVTAPKLPSSTRALFVTWTWKLIKITINLASSWGSANVIKWIPAQQRDCSALLKFAHAPLDFIFNVFQRNQMLLASRWVSVDSNSWANNHFDVHNGRFMNILAFVQLHSFVLQQTKRSPRWCDALIDKQCSRNEKRQSFSYEIPVRFAERTLIWSAKKHGNQI